MIAELKTRRRWYAVRCHSARHVLKAATEIKRLGVPIFVPKAYRQEKQGKWMVSVEDGLLFPPYLFIAMRAPGPWKSAHAVLWGAVCDVDGVDRIMGNRSRDGDIVPIAVPYKEMRKIRTKERAGQRQLAAERFQPGQKVKITGGPFTGFDGVFEMPEHDRVKVLLSLFGAKRSVHLDENEIRAA